MKKALAILSAVALVSFAAFAEDAAAAAPASLAPTVTGGIDASAEVNLASGNTVATKAEGSLETATSSAASSKLDVVGLKATKFKTIDWVNFDWSKASIKVEGKYDAYKADGDDYSWLKTTSTWKDFFGFAIKHEFVVNNKKVGTGAGAEVNFAKGADTAYDNKVTASIAKDAIQFSATYDADDVFGLLNIGQTGTKLEQIFAGFRNVSFEYTNDEVYGKLVYKNAKETADVTNEKGYTSSITDANNLDAAIIEGKKFFGVWTVRLNDAGETKLRLANLDSAGKTDKFEYVIGQDLKIQESNAGKQALNVLNTITPVDGLTVKVQAVVPSNKALAFGDWLNGTSYETKKDLWKDSVDYAASNLAIDASYVLANVGTLNAGTAILQDYVVADGTKQGLSRYFKNYADSVKGDETTPPTVGFLTLDATQKYHWGTAVWADAKLDKLLGDGKAVYVAFDTQFGEYLDAKTIAAQTSGITNYVTKGLTRSGLNLETKLALNEKLTVAAGTAIRFGTGLDFKAASNSTQSWDEVNKPTGFADGTYANNWNEGNDAYVTYYRGDKKFSPFELKVKAEYALDSTFKKVYVGDEFKALAADLKAVTGGKAVKGWADKNTLTLGSDLAVTKNGTLTVEGGWNLFLGTPTADQLYITTGAGTSDSQKKVIKANAEAVYGSGDFSPVNLKVAYSIKF